MDIYKPKDFADKINVTVNTLQRWDREGTLKAVLQIDDSIQIDITNST